mmetsp:Transcript_2634/g.6891  ORF Transcript_2634/g.6891 Transcript_2634/m.6891 type:complete len:204 (+) Transcript_2634:2006-2617(+)
MRRLPPPTTATGAVPARGACRDGGKVGGPMPPPESSGAPPSPPWDTLARGVAGCSRGGGTTKTTLWLEDEGAGTDAAATEEEAGSFAAPFAAASSISTSSPPEEERRGRLLRTFSGVFWSAPSRSADAALLPRRGDEACAAAGGESLAGAAETESAATRFLPDTVEGDLFSEASVVASLAGGKSVIVDGHFLCERNGGRCRLQ